MITELVDVPCDVPQTLAFAVPAARFTALRDGLRDAYERGDGAALEAQWDASLAAFRADAARVRWRVPAATLAGLVREMITACDRVVASESPPDEDDVAPVRAQELVWSRRAASATWFDLDPARWFRLVAPARIRLRSFLAGRSPAPMRIEWDWWGRQLAELEIAWDVDPGADAPPWSHLERMRSVRFFLEDYDYATHESRRGREVSADDVENPLRDIAVLADGSETTPYDAWHTAELAMRLPGHLELLVGPHVRSRGPGPFLAPPSAARTIVDRSWRALPIFFRDDAGRRGGSSWNPPAWQFLDPADIARSIDEVTHAAPSWEWAEDLADVYDPDAEAWGRRKPPLWGAWADGLPEWWPRCRERYLGFLEEVRDRGDIAVFTSWTPDDQGTIVAPLDDDLGTRVVI